MSVSPKDWFYLVFGTTVFQFLESLHYRGMYPSDKRRLCKLKPTSKGLNFIPINVGFMRIWTEGNALNVRMVRCKMRENVRAPAFVLQDEIRYRTLCHGLGFENKTVQTPSYPTEINACGLVDRN
jgi:hypothetical protein